MADTRKKGPSLREQVEQARDRIFLKERLRDGFLEWLLDRASEVGEVLDALAPQSSPLEQAIGPGAHQVYTDLDTVRDLFREIYERARPRLQPHFLLVEESV